MDSRFSATVRLVALGAVGLLAYGLLAYALSFAFSYLSWVGAPLAIAKWTPLMVFLWCLSGMALAGIDRGAPLSDKFAGVYVLGPVLAFVFGKVDVLGAALYFVPPAVTFGYIAKRAKETNEARLRSLRGSRDLP